MPQQRQAVAVWWSQLNQHERVDVLEIEPTDFIPGRLARDLQLHGVHINDVSLAWDLHGLRRAIRVYVQPAALKDFLSSVRIWVAAWDTSNDDTASSREGVDA